MALRDRFLGFLFSAVRRPFFGRLAGAGFACGSALLPLRRYAETETLAVVAHPRPGYPFHALAVPKAVVRDFEALSPGAAARFAFDLTAVLPELFAAAGCGRLRLVINGGARQDVAQLHAHLIDDAGVVRTGLPLPGDGDISAVFAAARAALTDARPWTGYSIQLRFASDRPEIPTEARLRIDRAG